jgi:hypothetical protein
MTSAVSFDHLVGAGEKRRRDREPEGLRSLEVDDEFEPGGAARQAGRPAFRLLRSALRKLRLADRHLRGGTAGPPMA